MSVDTADMTDPATSRAVVPAAPDASDEPAAQRRALRAIATLEAFKGLVAAVAAVGLLHLLDHDLHAMAEALIGHVGLDPGGHYPTLLLHYADVVQDTQRRQLMLTAAAYVLVRWTEAWGLWHQRAWGEWLGALSGAVYVPFELRHLLHRPTLGAAAIVAANLAVVAYLGWRLWRRRTLGLQANVPP